MVWARTPVYMSLELINSRNGAKGYDLNLTLNLLALVHALVWARTPVYMSLELINSRNGAKGYDLNVNLNTGTHALVWARTPVYMSPGAEQQPQRRQGL